LDLKSSSENWWQSVKEMAPLVNLKAKANYQKKFEQGMVQPLFKIVLPVL